MGNFLISLENRPFLFCGSIALACLTGSLIAMCAGHIPCLLCIVQQILFFNILVISAVGLFSFSKKRVLFALLGSSAVLCLVAAYHIFVRYSLIPDPCFRASLSIETHSDFLKALNANQGCSTSSLDVFGVPAQIFSFLAASSMIFMLLGCKVKKFKSN